MFGHSVAMMPAVVMMMMVVVMAPMVVVPRMVVMVVVMPPRASPMAIFDPAPAVPDRAADVADVLNKSALGRGSKSGGARQGQRFRAAGDKGRRCNKR